MQVKPRIFTLSEAQSLLPRIKEITARVHEEVEDLRVSLYGIPEEADRSDVDSRIEGAIRGWFDEVLSLGAEPKGVGLVDFDSGDGFYYCWRYGEEEIEHIHTYEAGFAGRRRLAR